MEQTGDAMLPAAAAKKVAVNTARAEEARPAAFSAASVFSPASVATEATATEATSRHRGGADAPCCISALFALAFAACGGDS